MSLNKAILVWRFVSTSIGGWGANRVVQVGPFPTKEICQQVAYDTFAFYTNVSRCWETP